LTHLTVVTGVWINVLVYCMKLLFQTKHEKLLYAVTTCFPALISDIEVCDVNIGELQDLHIDRY
jgi:hypothetical protein